MRIHNPWSVSAWIVVDPEIGLVEVSEIGFRTTGVGERTIIRIEGDSEKYIALAKGEYDHSAVWLIDHRLAVVIVGGSGYLVRSNGLAEKLKLFPIIGSANVLSSRVLLVWTFTDITAIDDNGTRWSRRGIMDDDLSVQIAGNELLVRGTVSGSPHELRLVI